MPIAVVLMAESMDTLTVVTVVLLGLVLVVLTWLLVAFYRSRGQIDTARVETSVQLLKAELIARQSESLIALRESAENTGRLLNERLAEGTGALDRRMEIFSELENKLGQLATQARNIEQVGNNILSLSDLLKPPKLRGNLGEIFLENLLGEILPRALYEIQYRFSTGGRVDAAIHLAGKMIPIDAKFPLEAYERLLATPEDGAAQKAFAQSFRKHVDDISSKYVRPDENTTDFAIMYIPTEAVYYQLVSQSDTSGLDYALSKKIIPSSPGHLYGFLASLAAMYSEAGLAGAGLAEGSRELSTRLKELAEAVTRLEKYHERVAGSLRSMSISFEKAKTETTNLSYGLERLRDPSSHEQSAPTTEHE